MSEDMKTPEILKPVKAAWIFDIDGVITNPQEKKITEPKILDEIIKRLEQKEPVALVTGRSRGWVSNRVVTRLETQIGDKKLLDNLFVSEEFGGSYSTYESGIRKDIANEQFSIPPGILLEVEKVIKDKFSESMFLDQDKKTMVSIEMKDNYPVEEFKPFQAQLIAAIREIVNRYDKEHQLEIHQDTIATNIRNKKSNKKNAAKQVLNWLLTRGVKPQKYLVFGDNTSDLEIAQELNVNGLPVEFIFVGKRRELDKKAPPFKITFTQNKYDKGTLEFLEQASK